MSLAGTVLCVLVVSTPTYGQTQATAKAADSPPQWAYPENNPNYKPPVDDGKPVRVPNSTAGYTWTQLRTRFIAPVWHPQDHGPLPDIVAKGRDPNVFACGFCHRADGPGGPENADLAGLPKSYLIQQMADYKGGARVTSVSSRLPTTLMIGLSKSITDAEVEAAAAYFSALKPRKRIKVVESDMVPKSYIAGPVWAAGENGEREPLGQRILEIPDDLIQFESRDPRSMFTAYVPVGSLAKGDALVNKGGPGKTFQCAPCHGPDLKGLGPLPHRRPLAKLHVSPALRLRAWRADRRVEPPDGTGGEQPRPERYTGDCSLSCFTRPVTRL